MPTDIFPPVNTPMVSVVWTYGGLSALEAKRRILCVHEWMISVVVVRRNHGKEEQWKLLGETWKLIENPVKFNEYVEAEVEKLLSD